MCTVVLVTCGENRGRRRMVGEHRGRVQRRRQQLFGYIAGVGRSARYVPARLPDRHRHQNRRATD